MFESLRRALRVGCAALVWSMAATAATAAMAAEAPTVAADPVLEAKVMAIAAELRCLVCQNQTIADSSAGLAVDLRNQVRDMLRQGKSRQQIVSYMTDRYGDFVLYRPPLKESTALLWFGPAALLLGGLVMLVWVLRRRNRLAPEAFEPEEDDALAPKP